MQETKYIDKIDGSKKRKQEIFLGEDEAALKAEMDKRLEDLKVQGHEFVRRAQITGRQALRVAMNQALHGDDRLLTKIKQQQRHRGGHK